MRRIKLTIEYDGTDYAGFQTQAPGIRTVQTLLTEAVSTITSREVILYSAGRTDSGVHAVGQVVHFDTVSKLDDIRMLSALNALLPRDIAVSRVEEVSGEFHARFSASRRTYSYLIWNRPSRSALWDRYSFHEPRVLDVPQMRIAAHRLIGSFDFRSFANAGGNPGSTMVRRVEKLQIRSVRQGELIIAMISANAFLRSMVRNMMAALVDVGRGALSSDELVEILEAKDRRQNPCATISPRGLCLYRVDYATDKVVSEIDEEG